MPQQGRLVDWNDERGFGFIRTDEGERVFLHISALRGSGRRPSQGDEIRFVPGFSSDGRLEAKSVKILGAAAGKPAPHVAAPRRTFPEWRVFASLVIMALIAAGIFLERMPQHVAWIYGVMGVVAFVAYGSDKRYATFGQWRTPEVTLLGLDLFFGLVGGLLAQAIFRHKTRKPRYVMATMLIVTAHLGWLTAFTVGALDIDVALGALTTGLVSIR
ncbi:Uncharacterized membrane protein YsdA, DUF1294 family [Devosia lucknowensis]|uniref:Uncharacterized membrane protein YsdA, DUF1294 family n=1 Tax=Devosia lucknowensis TaxID=1096929 RepID=A0A1Y6GBQ4_9HYPH|nr:DUF1294 domain-containing protein [Devosia lucknowensis]SMQ85897.1 Uncharacterized membrane protein YsdA, DUF1294 family [Devosia lucknowensis]